MSGLTRNIFFLTSRKVLSSRVHYLKILPSWGPGCPDGSFAHFQVQARKRGVLGLKFGVEFGVFCVSTYPQMSCVTAE